MLRLKMPGDFSQTEEYHQLRDTDDYVLQRQDYRILKFPLWVLQSESEIVYFLRNVVLLQNSNLLKSPGIPEEYPERLIAGFFTREDVARAIRESTR